MTCSHETNWKCIQCAPELWHPPQEHIDAINRKIYQEIVENLVRWNRAYRNGEPEVSDFKYDSYEDSLRKAYPKHPLFDMVGNDETKIQEILDYIPMTRTNPIL